MGQRMIEANGVELSAEAFGDPRVLRSVLIMGIGASMLWWEQGFCGMLADGGRFVIVTTTATPALGDLRARTPRVRRRRPAFARFLYLRYRGLQREFDAYLRDLQPPPRPHGPNHRWAPPRATHLRCPENGADEPHLSAHPGVCSA